MATCLTGLMRRLASTLSEIFMPLSRTLDAPRPTGAEWSISYLHEPQLLLVETGGHHDVSAVRSLVTAVMAEAKKHNCRRVLMDARNASGSFNAVQIYNFPDRVLALEPRFRLRLAVVFSKPHADHQFFQNVCLNRFLQVGVFYKRESALAWFADSGSGAMQLPGSRSRLA